MSDLTPQPNLNPAYELDSVNEDTLDAMIVQLGLKKHSKHSIDPHCVICRRHVFLIKQANAKQSHTKTKCVSNGT